MNPKYPRTPKTNYFKSTCASHIYDLYIENKLLQKLLSLLTHTTYAENKLFQKLLSLPIRFKPKVIKSLADVYLYETIKFVDYQHLQSVHLLSTYSLIRTKEKVITPIIERLKSIQFFVKTYLFYCNGKNSF